MGEKDDKLNIVVNLGNSYNPYEDKNLTETQPDGPTLNQKEAFNDAIKLGDIIVGHQRNRTISDYPRRSRRWIRLYSIITLLVIAVIAAGTLRHFIGLFTQ